MSDDQIDGNPNVCFGVADEQLDALIAYATVMSDLTTSFSCPSFRCAADASGCLQLPWEAQVDRSEAGNSRHGGVCLRRLEVHCPDHHQNGAGDQSGAHREQRPGYGSTVRVVFAV